MFGKKEKGCFMNLHVISLAIKEAEKSKERHKIGAIIFKGNKIISKAYNEIRACSYLHPKRKRFEFSLHAEQRAIINARTSLKRASILVVRINKSGEFLLAKPCKYCLAYIEDVGIKNIYYSTKNGVEKLC